MILPTKIKLNQAKAAETKLQIDEGVALARKVDAMRELKLTQETNIKQWRDTTVNAVQMEIVEWNQKRDMAIGEAKAAERRREEARKPLDFEWIKVKEEKNTLIKDQNNLFLDKQSFQIEIDSFEKEKIKVEESLEKALINEKFTEKLKQEAEALQKDAKGQNVLVRSERDVQQREYEKKLSEVNQSAKEYEVALQTIQIKEKQVEDKESELITRENDLARRINNLQRAQDRIN